MHHFCPRSFLKVWHTFWVPGFCTKNPGDKSVPRIHYFCGTTRQGHYDKLENGREHFHFFLLSQKLFHPISPTYSPRDWTWQKWLESFFKNRESLQEKFSEAAGGKISPFHLHILLLICTHGNRELLWYVSFTFQRVCIYHTSDRPSYFAQTNCIQHKRSIFLQQSEPASSFLCTGRALKAKDTKQNALKQQAMPCAVEGQRHTVDNGKSLQLVMARMADSPRVHCC